MKRCRMKMRPVAALLAGLLLAADATGQTICVGGQTLRWTETKSGLAAALARQVRQVRRRFHESRRALEAVPGPAAEPAYPRQEVEALVARTGKDLDRAIEQVGEPGLDALRAWAAEEIRQIRKAAAPSLAAAPVPGLSTPHAVAVVAGLGGFPAPQPASRDAAEPEPETGPETIAAETVDRLLDQVGAVVGRILLLAQRDDLEVKLWVGSTPAPRATFSFWPLGRLRGSPPPPLIIRTNGQRNRVLRGLYSYRASGPQGAGAGTVEYPGPAGAPAAGVASEPLDLVDGSSFFCCRFGERYCHHVAKKKECRP
jgi:hypothetical protein